MVVQHDRIRAGLLAYPPGDVVGEHAHLESDEVFHIISGSARFVIDDQPLHVGAGDLLHVGAGERHAIHVTGDVPLVMLAAVSPNRDDAWVAAQQRADADA
jgi:mannose-6-phosphate isomerase-like protein (cupin superfamily)